MSKTPESHEHINVSAEQVEWIEILQLDRTDLHNRDAIRRLYHEHWGAISTAPGSSGNHQCWPGGYLEHIRQVNDYVTKLYKLWLSLGVFASLDPSECFELEEAMTVTTLHDIEKPFGRSFDAQENLVKHPQMETKTQKDAFKQSLLEQYGIALNTNQQNAMHFVEGIRDAEYTPGQRVMSPMAVLCHIADLMSARASFNLGNPGVSYAKL